MPAKATIHFKDHNPAGANSEDGYVVLRKAGSDPWSGSSTGGSPNTPVDVFENHGQFNAEDNFYEDDTISANVDYFYRVVYYRGPSWAARTEYHAGGVAIGPVRVPDSSRLGYPNNVPSESSGVPYFMNTEPICHMQADSLAFGAGWSPGTGNLWDNLRTFGTNSYVPNEADTYSSGPGTMSFQMSDTATFNQSVYLWRGDDDSLDPIPVLGDRFMEDSSFPMRGGQYSVSQAAWNHHVPQGVGQTGVFWDEGVTVFGVSTTSNNVNATTGRDYGNKDSEQTYNHGTLGANGFSMYGDFVKWSDGSAMPTDHWLDSDLMCYGASGCANTTYPQSRSWGWGFFGGGFGYGADIGGFMKASEVNPDPQRQDYAHLSYPVPTYFNYTSATTTIGRPNNLSITASVMQPDGRQRIWINGGVDHASHDPILLADPTPYVNDAGVTVNAQPLTGFSGIGLSFWGYYAVLAEYLFIPKALSSSEFTTVVDYLNSKYSGYLFPQGTYNQKFA